jgi:DNA-binding NarL/FixJ family response regulator
VGAETEAESVTIVLADDHEVVRAGIREVLEDEPGFEVGAEAGEADTAAR